MAYMENVPIIWFDSTGDGFADSSVGWGSSGLWSNDGSTTTYHKFGLSTGGADWSKADEATIKQWLSGIANSLAVDTPYTVAGGDKWSYSIAAGGEATGAGQSTEGWTGASTGATEFKDVEITPDDFIENGQQVNPERAFEILQEKGAIPAEAIYNDYAQEIAEMPQYKGADPEAEAEREAGVAEDVYGFETEISRAQEDIATSEQRLGLDLGEAGTGARSDIYGLQGQGGQARRAGMFGKGLGGGAQALAGQDISSGMAQQGSGRMAQLGGVTRGLREGAADVQGGLRRTIADATTGLYGVGGTGADTLGVGGIYGLGGSEASGKYLLEEQAERDWETDMDEFLSYLG